MAAALIFIELLPAYQHVLVLEQPHASIVVARGLKDLPVTFRRVQNLEPLPARSQEQHVGDWKSLVSPKFIPVAQVNHRRTTATHTPWRRVHTPSATSSPSDMTMRRPSVSTMA